MARRLHPPIHLSLKQRRLLALIAFVFALSYLPLNRFLSGGGTVQIWLDHLIPFWAVWILPYLSAIIAWNGALLLVTFKADDELFLIFVTTWLTNCVIGFSIFFLFPNYMVRPEITGTGWADQLVRLIYANDRTYNAFPSMHIWMTTTVALVLGRWRPKWRWLLWAYWLIVAASTLFTKQHWILDIVGGMGLAFLSYMAAPHILAFVAGRRRPKGEPDSGRGG